MRFPPEAYLIGAQKAGTTTLAYLLNQHPRVALSQLKEPHFFTHNWEKGLGWYKAKFNEAPDSTILLDASTSYSMAPLGHGEVGHLQESKFKNVPERLFSVNPEARFIYLLREPVARTYSGYWHSVRTGREDKEFRDALRSNSLYLDVSDYYGQLSLWLDYFPLSSFFLVLFEDLKEEPERVAEECLKFLGVDLGAATLQLGSAKNQSYNATQAGRKVNKLLAGYPGFRNFTNKLARKTPPIVRRGIKKTLVNSESIPKMDDEDREFLAEYFREKNRELELTAGLSLDRWQA